MDRARQADLRIPAASVMQQGISLYILALVLKDRSLMGVALDLLAKVDHRVWWTRSHGQVAECCDRIDVLIKEHHKPWLN